MRYGWIFAVVFAGACFALTIFPGTTPHVLTLPSHFPEIPSSSKVELTEEGIVLGRYLFYDSILSLKRNLACATCHRQEYAFSEGPDPVSTHSENALRPRNTPALFNLAWTGSFFWDGRAKSLRDQVFEVVPSRHEMQLDWNSATRRICKSHFYKQLFRAAYGNQKIDRNLIANALLQFEITLISGTSKYDRVLQGIDYFTEDEYRGFVLMNEQTKGDCMHCHTTDGNPLGTTYGFSNNGLNNDASLLSAIDQGRYHHTGKESDRGVFKIPSVRNLLFTAPYMHDGRFRTLEEVLRFYSSEVQEGNFTDTKMQFAHKGGVHLTAQEQAQIIAFLRTLSDSVFVQNEDFTNPFYSKK